MRPYIAKLKKTDGKFFIEYKDDSKIRSLRIKLPQMNGYVNSFKETKYMSFDIKNDESLVRIK